MAIRSDKENTDKLARRVEGMRFSRRSLTYLVRTLALILVISCVCLVAFLSAARISNSYILVMEGMNLRASCILGESSTEELSAYFTDGCIASDARLYDGSYLDYTITSYNYSVQVTRFHVWPWQQNSYVEITETMQSLKGSPKTDDANATLPAWTTLRYRVNLVQRGGRWSISGLTVLEVDPDVEPVATYDPDLSPLPMATPTPTPTASPVLSPTP